MQELQRMEEIKQDLEVTPPGFCLCCHPSSNVLWSCLRVDHHGVARQTPRKLTVLSVGSRARVAQMGVTEGSRTNGPVAAPPQAVDSATSPSEGCRVRIWCAGAFSQQALILSSASGQSNHGFLQTGGVRIRENLLETKGMASSCSYQC